MAVNPEFDINAFVQALSISFLPPGEKELFRDYAVMRGSVASLPLTSEVIAVLDELGFVSQMNLQGTGRLSHEVVSGGRGAERIEVVFLASHSLAPPTDKARMSIEWKSRRRPLINAPAYSWQGRSWPALFDEARVYHEDSKLLILNGILDGGGFSACSQRYRAWASTSGLKATLAAEPDLQGDLRMSDADFVVTLNDRGPDATFTVTRPSD